MPLGLVEKLKKVTLKTLVVYLFAALLVVTAKPRMDLFGLGLVIVMLGEGLRIWATGHLRKNQEVTTTGPYAYVKNPLYFGTFLLMAGFCLMANHFLFLAVGTGVFIFYYAPYKKRTEAERLAKRFGQTWLEYENHVPDYWPRWTPYEHRGKGRWNIHTFFSNSEHETLFAVLLGITVIGLNLF